MADPNNKWTQPAAPPAPMFFGKKERNLVKQVNDELAERVIGQPIAYYPISIEESNFNTVYGESIEKVCLPPVRAFAYVVVENEQTNERYGYEYQTKLTVNFSSKRLTADQNLYVRVGDFVQYGNFFYEIVRTYNDTRYYFGQVEHKFQISAECIRVREDSFKVMPAITRQPPSTTVAADGSSLPAPRTAPYPPVNASYILVGGNNKVTNSRVLTAGVGISITDGGRLGPVTITSTAASAVGPTGSIQFQTGDGSFSGSANLTFLTSSNVLAVAGGLSASVNISASAYYGDGSNLSGVGGTPGGSNTQIQFNNASAFGGSSNLTFDGTAVNITGQLTASTTISASSFHGDGSSLTGITTSAAGATTQLQYNNAGAFAGSSSLTFNGTTLTGSYTGSLAQLTTLSASFVNFSPVSGTLAGDGSYLGLDANNNVILSAGDGATTSPGGSNTQIQFNNAGSFGASSNLTFNGTTLTTAGNTHLSGGLVHKRTAITAATYTILVSDYYLGVDSTSNPITLTLPAASAATEGQTFAVKDESGQAGSNNITLARSGGDTIDGDVSQLIESPYGSVMLYTDGANWFVY